MNEDIVIPIAAFVTAVSLTVVILKYRLAARELEAESRRPGLPPDLMTRLERMEQSLDAVAVEVERISEGQRFTTKLLSEASGGDRLLARAPGSTKDST